MTLCCGTGDCKKSCSGRGGVHRRICLQGIKNSASYYLLAYAIGFNQERIYVIPLSITKKEISYADFFIIKKEELGIVNSIGNTEILTWAAFYDENRKELLSIWVRESNTKDSKAYPVNIQQKEEMIEFAKLINRWMEEVNTAHGVVASKKMTGSPIK